MAERQRSRSPRGRSQKENFLFVGNPGTGKSTLINGVIGEPLFKSKTSLDGNGVTFEFDQKDVQGKGVFMDTPGLSDEKLRVQAADAITKALKQNGFYRIFFVLTVEAGRVKPDDKTTMKLILDAAPTITDYSVIVNKATKKWVEEIKKPENVRNWVTTLMEGLPKVTASIHFMIRDNDLEDAEDVKYQAPADVIRFIKSAPGMYISSDDVKEVKPDMFAEMREEQAKIVAKLEADAEAREAAFKRQEEDMRAALLRQQEAMQQAQARADEDRRAMQSMVNESREEAARAREDAARAANSGGSSNFFGMIGDAIGKMFGM